MNIDYFFECYMLYLLFSILKWYYFYYNK